MEAGLRDFDFYVPRAAYHHDHEGAGFWRGPGLTWLGRRKLRCGEIQRVCPRIDTHRSCTPRSLYSLDDFEFARCGLAGHGKRAVAATGKGVAIKFGGVDAGANRQIGKNLSIIGTHDEQLLRPSRTEEAT